MTATSPPTSPQPLDEISAIEILAESFPRRDDLVAVGIGDDAARLAEPRWDLVTTDMMVERVHFDLELFGLREAAYRCLTANLSDIAAMGGDAGPFTLALGIPPERADTDDIRAIGVGLRAAVDAHPGSEAWLVGGDVTRSPGVWTMSITVLGASPERGALTRTAREGDHLVVFRELGAALAALMVAERHGSGTLRASWPGLWEALATPRAELEIGARLGASGFDLGLLDLSDGLLRDAARFRTRAGRPLRARLDVDALPVGNEVSLAAEQALDLDPWELALVGGEDYTLCAAVPPGALPELRALIARLGRNVYAIGQLEPGHGARAFIDGAPVESRLATFDHFASSS